MAAHMTSRRTTRTMALSAAALIAVTGSGLAGLATGSPAHAAAGTARWSYDGTQMPLDVAKSAITANAMTKNKE